jgi:diguanylate cyclase (GGDEF)-like protein/PAS domain S-box-containing protein
MAVQHQPSRKRRKPSTGDQPVDERRNFFGRRSFELARDVQCILDFEGRFKDVNPALRRVLGYTREELIGRSASEVIHPDDWERTAEEAERLARGDYKTREFENRYRNKDGEWVWVEWAAHAAIVEGLIYASGRNITKRKTREYELERAALVDPLTGLANRRGFERALERELAAAKRHSLSPALVVVDLDRFKAINDRHGHQTGDQLLMAAAQTLIATVRASDMPARLGGDEFAVLLPDCDLSTAEVVAGKIVSALRRQQVHAGDDVVPVSASAGVALLGQEGITSGLDLIRAADKAMYRAKRRRSSFATHDGPIEGASNGWNRER